MLSYHLALSSPFVTKEEYARMTGLPSGTINQYISQGRIIIKTKASPGEKVLINMIAMNEIAAREALAVLG